MTNIKDNLDTIELQILHTCQQTNRSADEVKLLAVSKTKPVEDLLAAYHAGQRLFGENYVQEGVEKVQQMSDLPDIEWHFIGPIQSNKTKAIAEHFHWVHSVDREKIITRLNEHRATQDTPLNVCLQVNISDEESKSGVTAEQVFDLLPLIENSPNLTFRGLMAIPAKTDVEQSFKKMKQLFEQVKVLSPTADTLSMGMSGDMSVAIANGSTMVRVGTAIFGARNK